MTAIEWLIEKIYARGPIGEDTPTWLKELYNQAKLLHKQEIIDAHIAGQPLYSCQSEKAETYYQETFVSKGSDTLKDYHIVDTNEMVQLPKQETFGSKDINGNEIKSQTLSEKYQEYKDWLNEIPEISDEEIEGAARTYTFDEYQKVIDYESYDTYNDFVNGAKWYREQLKQK
jgi:hypothetical protein